MTTTRNKQLGETFVLVCAQAQAIAVRAEQKIYLSLKVQVWRNQVILLWCLLKVEQLSDNSLLLPHIPRLCPTVPHTRHLLLFQGYFFCLALLTAGESSKIPLVRVFAVISSILISVRNVSLRNQRTHYTLFIGTQPQSYVCTQEEIFPMQRMTQTRSKQRQKESEEKWTVTAVHKRWHLSYWNDSRSFWN